MKGKTDNTIRPVRYIRLLSYPLACKVIDFIKDNDDRDYANITPGGVSTTVSDDNWNNKVLPFIKTLDWPYEICSEHPTKVTADIVKMLKETNVIN